MFIEMFVKEVVPEKEVSAIVTILLGISIEVKIMLSANASALISVTSGIISQSAKVISVLVSQPNFFIMFKFKVVPVKLEIQFIVSHCSWENP